MSNRALYRKNSVKGFCCKGCDYPAYAPNKRHNQKTECKKCLKLNTKKSSDRTDE